MKLGIMQPYLFPYIGYFQLIQSVDKFVLLDDVNYIKKGWINRNLIQVNGSRIALVCTPFMNSVNTHSFRQVFSLAILKQQKIKSKVRERKMIKPSW